MTKFYKWINESVNGERFKKYFNNPKDKNQYIKKQNAKLYDKDLVLKGSGNSGDPITLLNLGEIKSKIGTQKKDHYFVPIQHKKGIFYIDVNDIQTPIEFSRGESLGIQATNLIKTGNSAKENIILWGNEYSNGDFKEFRNVNELRLSIINGFKTNKKVPDYVSNEMERILNSGRYSEFEWGKIKSDDHKNQIGKYYGELLVGLCLMNGEFSAFNGDLQGMIGGQKIESFLMPISPSFPAADSLIKTNKKIIPISNKKGGGTGASFYTNLVHLIANKQDNELKSKTNILIQLKKMYQLSSKNVMVQIYNWGFTYLLNNVKISKTPIQIYETIRTKNLPDSDVSIIMNHIEKNKWKYIESGYLRNVLKNLPFSLTHFFLYTLHYLLSNDEIAKNIILDILGAKEYWQSDLQNTPWKNGKAIFNLKKSSETKLVFSPTRGKINDIKSSHAKLNYILK